MRKSTNPILTDLMFAYEVERRGGCSAGGVVFI